MRAHRVLPAGAATGPTRAIATAALAAVWLLQGCAGGQAGRAPAAASAPTSAPTPASPSTGTNLVSGSGEPVGDGVTASPAPAARPTAPPAAALPSGSAQPGPRAAVPVRPPSAPAPAAAASAPAPLIWPAAGTPVDAYLSALSPRQRECMTLVLERQNLSVERLRGMDAFPAGNAIDLTRSRCEPILARTDPARLRSDLRCTLDLPGEPVSRCEEAFVRSVDGKTERLALRDALRAEVDALGDPARRVTVARFERPEAAVERQRGAGVPAAPSAASLPVEAAATRVPDAKAVAPSGAQPAPQSPVTLPVTMGGAPTLPPPASGPVAGTPPSASTAAPSGAAATLPAARTGPRFVVFVTCGNASQHLRVEDCFAGRRPTTLELRRADGSRQVYGANELLRAGPTGKDGLGLALDAPFEVRARNASDTLLLGLRVVDRNGGRTVSFEQATRGGTVTARQ